MHIIERLASSFHRHYSLGPNNTFLDSPSLSDQRARNLEILGLLDYLVNHCPTDVRPSTLLSRSFTAWTLPQSFYATHRLLLSSLELIWCTVVTNIGGLYRKSSPMLNSTPQTNGQEITQTKILLCCSIRTRFFWHLLGACKLLTQDIRI